MNKYDFFYLLFFLARPCLPAYFSKLLLCSVFFFNPGQQYSKSLEKLLVVIPLFAASCNISGSELPAESDAWPALLHAWTETRVEPTPAPGGLVTNLGGTGPFVSHGGSSES